MAQIYVLFEKKAVSLWYRNIKYIKVMKVILTYSYYSRSRCSWVHVRAYTKHEACEKARLYDSYIKFSDLSLLMRSGRYV